MSTTVRLPDGLRQRADVVAARRGLSLNALIAVALDEYLERQVNAPVVAEKPPVQAIAASAAPTVPVPPGVPHPVRHHSPSKHGKKRR